MGIFRGWVGDRRSLKRYSLTPWGDVLELGWRPWGIFRGWVGDRRSLQNFSPALGPKSQALSGITRSLTSGAFWNALRKAHNQVNTACFPTVGDRGGG